MAYKLIIKEEASIEIENAFAYYENQSDGLGFRFLQELDIRCNRIRHNPQHYPFFLNQKRFRSNSLDNFPFSILFEIINEESNCICCS